MQQIFFGEFLKKTSRKKRKHALDQENDQENVQEKNKVFRLKNINHF